MVITLPFSVACVSLSLAWMGIMILLHGTLLMTVLLNHGQRKSHLTWMLIPLLYLISLSYSRHVDQGWGQWVNFLPLILTPLFFLLYDFNPWKAHLIFAFALAANVSILMHAFIPAAWIQEWIVWTGPHRIFDSPAQQCWIWWAALLTLIMKKDKKLLDHMLMIIAVFGLMYLGHLGLLLLAYILFVISEWKNDKHEIAELLTRVIIFLPVFFIAGWIFFNAFQSTANSWSILFLSQYTKGEVVGPIHWFLTDAEAAFAQWWIHPLSGVGIGDYQDAMWNQYQKLGQDPPEAPYTQMGHMLVCTGILSIPVLGFIFKSYLFRNNKTMTLVSILLIALFFYTPFTSVINTAVFLFPLLLSSGSDDKN